MSLPITYITKNFFINFCKNLLIPLKDITIQNSDLVFLEEIIFSKSKVYFDINVGEYLLTDKGVYKNYEDGIFCNYLKYLNSKNKIEFSETLNNELESQNGILSDVQPLFLLLDKTNEECEKMANNYGVICISKEMKINQKVKRVCVDIVHRNININLDLILEGKPYCNSLIIEDPYLFKNDRDDFICELIGYFYNENYNKDFPVTIIHNRIDDPQQVLRIKSKIQDIEEIYPKIIIEFIQKNGIHDRNIFSNTFWISCDYGFCRSYSNSATKWVMFPIGIYFEKYFDRKEESASYYESKKSGNYLVTEHNN